MKCPRCDSETIKTISTSPVPGVWEYYGCTTCQYSWRSTEHPVVHDRSSPRTSISCPSCLPFRR